MVEVRFDRRKDQTKPLGVRQGQFEGEPPHLNWSNAMFMKRRTENGEQATQTRGNCSEAAAS